MTCYRTFGALPGLALALALAGCGEEAKKAPDLGAQVEEAAHQVERAARQMGAALVGGSQVEPVDFRELKRLLPESVAGLKRAHSEGSKTNVVGIASSRVLGVYQDGKGARLDIEILDVGNLAGVASVLVAWVHVEIDKEGDDGYERTTTLAGRKAFERYSKRDRTGELDVVVAGRFVVTVRGTGVDMKTFREAVERLDLAKLEALRAAAAPPPTAAKSER